MTMPKHHQSPESDRPVEFRKDGGVSKLRAHKGNVPVLPQTKLCPHCPARFTRTTHLNRHLRTHSSERGHRCDNCGAEFTRSDMLTRHRRSCNDPANANRLRKKSCKACAHSKVKCDLDEPCGKCKARGRECVYPTGGRLPRLRTIERKKDPHSPKRVSSAAGPALTHVLPSRSDCEPVSRRSSIHELVTDSRRASLYGVGSDDTSPSQKSLFDGVAHLDLSSHGSCSSYHTSSQSSHCDTGSEWTDEHSVHFVPRTATLSSHYSGNMFEPLFSTVFCETSPTLAPVPIRTAPPFAPPGGVPAMDQMPADFIPMMLPAQADSPPNHMPWETRTEDGQAFLSDPSSDGSVDGLSRPSTSHSHLYDVPLELATPQELHYYQYLFESVHLKAVHPLHVTFDLTAMPGIFKRAMEASGALYAKGDRARAFVRHVLLQARHDLPADYAQDMSNPIKRQYTMRATAMLQTMGMYHQDVAEHRPYAILYFQLMIDMIRRTCTIEENASWRPSSLTDTSLEIAWKQWAEHEHLKRLVWTAFDIDTCMVMYLGHEPLFTTTELTLCLPCEEALWVASTADEWLNLLNKPSPYGTLQQRLLGMPFQSTWAAMSSTSLMTQHVPLGPLAHFTLIHVVLSHLFTLCVPRQTAWERDEVLCSAQFALHNWLQNYLAAPEEPVSHPGQEQPFFHQPLPFYWLGQVALLAYQEDIAPFGVNELLVGDARFKIVKKWLLHIRTFLKRHDQSTTLFWDELMRIRLDAGSERREEAGKEGLVGFLD